MIMLMQVNRLWGVLAYDFKMEADLAEYLDTQRARMVQVDALSMTAQKQTKKGLRQQLEKERLVHSIALRIRVEKEKRVHAIALRIRNSLDLQTCLQTTVDEVRQCLQTDRVLIYSFNADGQGYVPVESVGASWLSVAQKTMSDPCLSENYANFFSQGQPKIVADIYQASYSPHQLDFLTQLQICAKLIVPIFQAQHLWGLMIVHECKGPRIWEDTEVDLLQRLATQVAIALQQAELYEQTQRELSERKRMTKALEQARDEALAAARIKSEFLAVMSHEIRTPMNGVIGMTGLLLDTALTPQQQHYATTIRDCGDSLLKLINNILDMSKMESDKLELEELPFDVERCVKESVELLRSEADEKQIQIDYEIAFSFPSRVIGDVTRLRQILVNLLSNAVKFTQQGSVSIGVEATAIEPAVDSPSQRRCEIKFTIQDSGMGIAEDKRDRLFQPFSQVDSSISRQYGGTGLGLAISQRLCKMMGGQIEVHSELGKGSCFYFTLNLQAVNCEAMLTGKRLLIVDSNEALSSQIDQNLQAYKITIHVARSSYEALGIIAYEDPFNWVIINGQLKDMPSEKLVTALRSNRTTTPLFILSPQPVPATLATWLPLPLNIQSLKDSLCQALLESVVQPLPIDATLAQRLPLKILVAEDNLVNQQLVQQWLQKMGYRADIVGNGQEVLEALHRQPYDLVLMDVHMPKMDGFSATERILQQWSAAQRPKIIAMTANAMAGDRDRCLTIGMDGYVSKPVCVHELATAIETCCSGEGLLWQNPSDRPPLGPLATVTKPSDLPELLDRPSLEATAQALGGLTQTWLLSLIRLYEQQGAALLNQLSEAVWHQDYEAIAYAAHTLKSSSAALGMARASHYCQQLETCGRSAQGGNLEPLLLQLKDAFQPSMQTIHQLARSLPLSINPQTKSTD
jgi:signal transduction histidine kinase/DNA-binding response OmpR family regulator